MSQMFQDNKDRYDNLWSMLLTVWARNTLFRCFSSNTLYSIPGICILL